MRYSGVESARVVAVIAVVAIHLYPTAGLVGEIVNQSSRFAVPFFFIISGYFFTLKLARPECSPDASFLDFLIKVMRIYLFWYLVYAYWPVFSPDNWGELQAQGFFTRIQGETTLLIEEFKAHALYYLLAGGRAYHLWFLPALGCGVGLLYLSSRLKAFWVGLCLAIALFAIALLLEPYKHSWLGLPVSMSGRNGPFFSSIFVFIGACFAKFGADRFQLKWLGPALCAGWILQLFEAFYIKTTFDIPADEQNYGLSTLLFASAFALFFLNHRNWGSGLGIDKLGRLTLGVYACHVMVIYVLRAYSLTPANPALAVFVVAAVSILVTYCMTKIPVLRKTV